MTDTVDVSSKRDLINVLKSAKDTVLSEWDVSFGINGEVLGNIMNFSAEINTDILMKFYNDKVLIQLKSPDNIQFAEVSIVSSDILDYKPNIDGDPERRDAKSLMKDDNGNFKGILVDMRGTADEIESFSQKDDLVVVRVDTHYYKRIEFHCPGNVVVWAQLMDPTTALSDVDKLPGIIKKVRNDQNIKKASVIIEPATFARICAIGGKGGKKRDIDERIFIELDKKDGLYVTSGDKLKGRIFALKPMEIGMSATSGMCGDVPGDMREGGTDDIMEEMGGDMGGMEEYSFAPGRGDKKKYDKKSPDKAPMDQLLGMEIESTQYIYLNKEFMVPFVKIKGISPIVLEVRTDKPLILEQSPFNGVKALLTIAPRIEIEE